jgi:hypothetical protein
MEVISNKFLKKKVIIGIITSLYVIYFIGGFVRYKNMARNLWVSCEQNGGNYEDCKLRVAAMGVELKLNQGFHNTIYYLISPYDR